MTVQINGDLLALDPGIRQAIHRHASALEARFPSHDICLTTRIAEEFDPLNGHRVRCELAAAVDKRQHLIVREARKTAEEAIAGAFDGAKRKFRQLSHRATVKREIPGEEALAASGMA